MAKVKGSMNLLVQKIQMKECGDWFSPELANIEPGLYLCEMPDGGMFFMIKRNDGCVEGMFLPIAEIANWYAREAEQKIFEQIEQILVSRFKYVDEKLNFVEKVVCENNAILRGDDEDIESKLAMIEKRLDVVRNLIAELPKHSEQQRSTLAEMSDAVVNIIKATK